MSTPPTYEQPLTGNVVQGAPAGASSGLAAVRRRSMLIDVVRGIAITMVVIGHSNQGVLHRGWWGASGIGMRMDNFIYAVHMPAFFFISGVFLCGSVDKRGVPRFIRDKARSMIWPYLFFCCVGAVIIDLCARFVVQPILPPKLFLLALLGGNVSWFLPTIFFAVVIAALARRLPMPVFFLIAVALSTWMPETPVVFFTRGIIFLPFVALGMWVGRSYEYIERVPLWLAAIGAAGLAALILAVTAQRGTGGTWMFIPFGIVGTLMLLLVSRLLGRSLPARTLSWIGEASFGIFLLSQYPQGAGREVLLHIHHSTEPYLQVFFASLLAVTLPAWLYQRRDRLRIGWMFVFPW